MPEKSALTIGREHLAGVALELVELMPLPALVVNVEKKIFAANTALAEAFDYGAREEIEGRLAQDGFLASHFDNAVLSRFYEALYQRGWVTNWVMNGRTLSGREITMEINARARVRLPQGPADFLAAVFVRPGNVRDAEAFVQAAAREAELTSRAKTEFLSNISHELRTPLNIILGMLDLAVESGECSDDMRQNLFLAKEAADRLFLIVNDLILLSNLEARRLTSDISQFSISLMLKTLTRQFQNRADEKNICLDIEEIGGGDDLLEGGYNMIMLALEKALDNALKFTAAGGRVIVRAGVELRPEGPWLNCGVLDNGPGFADHILNSSDFFIQGDGSKTRLHGGLGLGLRLISNIVTALDGALTLANRDAGGASLSFCLPIRFANTSSAGF